MANAFEVGQGVDLTDVMIASQKARVFQAMTQVRNNRSRPTKTSCRCRSERRG